MICISCVCLNYKKFVLIKASNLSLLLTPISCTSIIYARHKFGDKIVLPQSHRRMVNKIGVITCQVITINTLSFLSKEIRYWWLYLAKHNLPCIQTKFLVLKYPTLCKQLTKRATDEQRRKYGRVIEAKHQYHK